MLEYRSTFERALDWYAEGRDLSSSLPDRVNRIFVLTHHKEIGMFVDTAKLIAMAYPQQTRLVVAGLPARYQAAMKELQQDA